MKERLQKIVSRHSRVSRRMAESMIAEGRVSVNDVPVARRGSLADEHEDVIRVDGKQIVAELTPIYLLLYKPSGYVTTLKDPENRPVVADLVQGEGERVFPVGRLDYDSEGLLIMTNDGSFAEKVQHPRYLVPKRYRARISGHLTSHDMQHLKTGVSFDGGVFKPRDIQIEKRNDKSMWISLTIGEGKNRMVRKGFAAIRHDVERLVRVAIGDIVLGNLKRGQYRHLTKVEVESLLKYIPPPPGKSIPVKKERKKG
ncbi:MAG: rRNA pseudouridine synthase [Syntrophobacterales bacterium]|jgi:23S rRNA pseudouridine2605 synthase|nr:rRNA pseudouridine synthase [Syntrophobacterales bacterium]